MFWDCLALGPGVSQLFGPMSLRGLALKNRIGVAPMCQYSCNNDGTVTDWHLVHLGSYATGGFGLIVTEAAAVVPEGRISPQDAGIWNDDHIDAWRRIVDFVHTTGAAIGVQLAHAGRKASTFAPFATESGSVPVAAGGWPTVAPSPLASPGLVAPAELSERQLRQVVEDFAAAAVRADLAGFDVVEIHAAHGYLLHEFLSPLSNQRTDDYGGDFNGRTRLIVEVVDAVRAAWPQDKPLAIRFSATDHLAGGWNVDETTALATLLKGHGVDLIDVSSGGLLPAKIALEPGYQVPFAKRVREESGVTTAAVGLITEPQQADQILADGSADLVFLGRAALREPSWPLRAAHELGWGDELELYPPQYRRGAWPKR